MTAFDLYLDDFEVGQTFRTGGKTFTESEIIDFAMVYDPQRFHIDVEAAKQSPFGGLIASGFQTFAVAFRLFHQAGIFRDASVGSPGCDELRWHLPVRPGDTLHVVAEVEEVRPSRSKPDRGILLLRHRTYNQREELVFSHLCMHMLLRQRPAD